MRVWLGCFFILLISTLGAPAKAAKPAPAAKFETAQTPAIQQYACDKHCEQFEDTEVITAAYTQHNPFGQIVLIHSYELLPAIYSTADSDSSTVRKKGLILPFYRLILFPFHAFW